LKRGWTDDLFHMPGVLDQDGVLLAAEAARGNPDTGLCVAMQQPQAQAEHVRSTTGRGYEIEGARMTKKLNYTEKAGMVNIHKCEDCGYRTVSILVVDGVTPFMITCPACGGLSHSMMYRVAQSQQPEMEWFRPKEEELRALTQKEFDSIPAKHPVREQLTVDGLLEENRRHMNQGGLFLRHVTKATMKSRGPKGLLGRSL
jgi:hypothetical protein